MPEFLHARRDGCLTKYSRVDLASIGRFERAKQSDWSRSKRRTLGLFQAATRREGNNATSRKWRSNQKRKKEKKRKNRVVRVAVKQRECVPRLQTKFSAQRNTGRHEMASGNVCNRVFTRDPNAARTNRFNRERERERESWHIEIQTLLPVVVPGSIRWKELLISRAVYRFIPCNRRTSDTYCGSYVFRSIRGISCAPSSAPPPTDRFT